MASKQRTIFGFTGTFNEDLSGNDNHYELAYLQEMVDDMEVKDEQV